MGGDNWRFFETIQMAIAFITIGVVAYSPIARAIGNRILHGKLPPPGSQQDAGRVDDLSGEVSALRQALYDQQERVDFTERMLAQARERGALSAPKDG
jgi:hypothetical protein